MYNFLGIVDLYKDFAFALSLVIPRMLGIFLLIPFLSPPVLPSLIRNGIVIGFSLIVVPIVMEEGKSHSYSDYLTWIIIGKEFFLGIVVGYLIAIFFYAVQSAGFFIDNQRGASIASTVDPLLGQQTSPIGIFFSQIVVVYFFTSGLFLIFLGALYRSYILWPVFSFFPEMSMQKTLFFMQQTDYLFYLALMFAGPAIIAMFLAELGLALISRFAPQLNVFFLAMPVKSAVAFFILIIYLPYLFSYIKDGTLVINHIFAILDGVFK
ncbi:MAG: type III secretion system export apparatus subunit SctT [Alphaproteobacteria bacterium]|jgi:type III secretion protein T|nr:type III secretion system export apparatus subunit SctT [Alphaproteobacteria bacterium]MBP9878046.1 type III secretion system export apparatus subunit SctT [Alphaproteobacteria bacterium]